MTEKITTTPNGHKTKRRGLLNLSAANEKHFFLMQIFLQFQRPFVKISIFKLAYETAHYRHRNRHCKTHMCLQVYQRAPQSTSQVMAMIPCDVSKQTFWTDERPST
ncbi:hypothetical protein PPYR_15726 [Photinus pyralis]|uniref:Uncharacterized protein n=1 Tax=Photinus pyralis TaxID=7054 RepID=A0A5N3ZY39_PHOPY|nr:hypothetical protein PPYR_15726 [Photinus pyralis]